ncbi:hypothetical protein GRJ2_002019100 [Grus japonensis]|uniref:Uncharacterized protein n=1 Tax=Grus japonensis TaxID=30415 RepID=A0ABC9XCW7_GRUJA
MAKSRCLGKENKNQFLPGFLIFSGLPYHEAGQSTTLVDAFSSSDSQKPTTGKLLLQCDATLSSKEACSAALPPWLCKGQKDFTFGNETYW